MDTLLKVRSTVNNEYLINVEWQSDNDPEMHHRMMLYHALARYHYNLPVQGIVMYIGNSRMNMVGEINETDLNYRYQQIYFRELDPAIFLQSNIPEEIIMDILAGKENRKKNDI